MQIWKQIIKINPGYILSIKCYGRLLTISQMYIYPVKTMDGSEISLCLFK